MRRARIIVIALAILGIGWAFAPRLAPPLYDGVGFPDEPYRFVVKPDGAKATKPPTTATGRTEVINGKAGAVQANSAEQAPQVSILIPVARLRTPAGTTSVVVEGRPAQPIDAPSGGYLWSNVYDIEASDQSVTLTDGSPPATLILRAATAQRPRPTIERYTGNGWTKIETIAIGNDIYQAPLPALGRYAVIGTEPLDFSKGGKSTTRSGWLISAGALVVIVVLVVVALRRRRELSRPSGD